MIVVVVVEIGGVEGAYNFILNDGIECRRDQGRQKVQSIKYVQRSKCSIQKTPGQTTTQCKPLPTTHHRPLPSLYQHASPAKHPPDPSPTTPKFLPSSLPPPHPPPKGHLVRGNRALLRPKQKHAPKAASSRTAQFTRRKDVRQNSDAHHSSTTLEKACLAWCRAPTCRVPSCIISCRGASRGAPWYAAWSVRESSERVSHGACAMPVARRFIRQWGARDAFLVESSWE